MNRFCKSLFKHIDSAEVMYVIIASLLVGSLARSNE